MKKQCETCVVVDPAGTGDGATAHNNLVFPPHNITTLCTQVQTRWQQEHCATSDLVDPAATGAGQTLRLITPAQFTQQAIDLM
jgi:hypothetical protein